ncbi:MAG: carbonic anhydrase [Bacteroidota bacterium]|nr:carbonic anhydrase [Bacteroidota bacterium]
MVRLQYFIYLSRWPNLRNPRRFSEKLQLYKTKYRDAVMTQCVDKYAVRKYIESKGLSSILNELYGVFDSVDEVDFSQLPDSFVMKTSNGGGGNNVIVVRDKDLLDIEKTKQELQEWTILDAFSPSREWAYVGIKKSKIVIEKLLVDDRNLDGSIDDYKFLCYRGKFHYLWVDKNRYSNHVRAFWDKDLKFLPGVHSWETKPAEKEPQLPDNINEMINLAEQLSYDFPFVRVDLYNIKGTIIFGELTFYPWGGYVSFIPDSFDYDLGKPMDISFFCK